MEPTLNAKEALVPYLYRGVCEELYHKLNGKLTPKKPRQKFASYACAGDPHAVCGSGVECGESSLNSVILHQWNQEGYATSGISTSPHVERAKYYALSGGKSDKGFIFKLSVDQLAKDGVTIYQTNNLVPFPTVPEDDEHILVANDFGRVPESSIVAVESVGSGIQHL